MGDDCVGLDLNPVYLTFRICFSSQEAISYIATFLPITFSIRKLSPLSASTFRRNPFVLKKMAVTANATRLFIGYLKKSSDIYDKFMCIPG